MLLEHRLIKPKTAPVLIGLLAALAALLGVFSMPVLDRDEARFAQASAQMVQSADLIDIRFQDTPRHKKPIGIYWMQSATIAVTTGPDARDIWAYRLPSVLGAILAALTTYGLGRTLYGHRIAFAGSALFAVSLLLGAEGGIAKTDAVLTGLTGLSLLALARVRLCETTSQKRFWAVCMWGAVALGLLVKGPITPMIAGLSVLALCVLERQILWLKVFFFWVGPVLAALIILPWLIGVQIVTEGAFLRDAILGDMAPKAVSGHEGHGAPPGSHLVLLSVLFLPAIVTLPAGINAMVHDWRSGADTRLAVMILTAMVVPSWVVFELLPTKLVHYTLPLFPALAVIAGLGFARWQQTPWLWKAIGLGLFGLSASLAAALPLGLAQTFDGPVWIARIGLVVIFGLALSCIFSLIRGRTGYALISALALGLSWHVIARSIVAPSLSALFPSEQVASAIETLRPLNRNAPLYSSYTEPSLVFLTGGVITLIDQDVLSAQISEQDTPTAPGGLYVIDQSRWPDTEMDQLQDWLEQACRVEHVDGLNYSRGDRTRLWIALTICEEGRPDVAQN